MLLSLGSCTLLLRRDDDFLVNEKTLAFSHGVDVVTSQVYYLSVMQNLTVLLSFLQGLGLKERVNIQEFETQKLELRIHHSTACALSKLRRETETLRNGDVRFDHKNSSTFDHFLLENLSSSSRDHTVRLPQCRVHGLKYLWFEREVRVVSIS